MSKTKGWNKVSRFDLNGSRIFVQIKSAVQFNKDLGLWEVYKGVVKLNIPALNTGQDSSTQITASFEARLYAPYTHFEVDIQSTAFIHFSRAVTAFKVQRDEVTIESMKYMVARFYSEVSEVEDEKTRKAGARV